MTADHAHFGTLCALAASGQLTQTELAELRGHAGDCIACRRRIVELNEVAAQLFLADAAAHSGRSTPKGMRDRFVTRAISEGVPLTIRSSPIDVRRLATAAAVILGVLIIAAAHRESALQGTTQSMERASVVRTAANPPFQGESADVTAVAVAAAAHPMAHTRYPQRKSLMRGYSIATAMVTQDALRSSPPLFRPPTFQLNSGTKGGGSPGLLADCERCAFVTSTVRPGFAFAPPAAFPDPDNSKPHFKLDPTAFRNVVLNSQQDK